MNEVTIITIIIFIWGFWMNRKWLKNYLKEWWWQMKIAWNKGKVK